MSSKTPARHCDFCTDCDRDKCGAKGAHCFCVCHYASEVDLLLEYKQRNNARRDEDKPELREAVDDVYRLLGKLERACLNCGAFQWHTYECSFNHHGAVLDSERLEKA